MVDSLLLALILSTPTADSDANAGMKGMDVLRTFVGNWTTEVTSKKAAWTPKDKVTIGTAVGRASMAGAFVEYRAMSVDGKHEDLQLMSYDGTRDLYRQWYFNSEGDTHEAVGKWDPTTRILTWTGTQTGATIVLYDHILDRDTIRWNGVTKDESGKVLLRLEGILKRRKENDARR